MSFKRNSPALLLIPNLELCSVSLPKWGLPASPVLPPSALGAPAPFSSLRPLCLPKPGSPVCPAPVTEPGHSGLPPPTPEQITLDSSSLFHFVVVPVTEPAVGDAQRLFSHLNRSEGRCADPGEDGQGSAQREGDSQLSSCSPGRCPCAAGTHGRGQGPRRCCQAVIVSVALPALLDAAAVGAAGSPGWHWGGGT